MATDPAIHTVNPNWEMITRLNKDLRDSATMLDREEARYLVDLYYSVQEQRQRAASQSRTDEPHDLTVWLFDQFRVIENDIKKALGVYATSQLPGEWAQSVHGIGPVIAAGLLAHIDVNPWKCMAKPGQDRCKKSDPHSDLGCHQRIIHTAGGVWRFAGLDPTQKWDKGQKRPWNARLKRLAWIIGDSFRKQRNSPKDFYGKFYEQRKEYETLKNQRGDYADLARESLETKKISDPDLKKTLQAGQIPAGRIELRCMRYATKLFLAHYHHVAYESEFNTAPPKPYVIEHLGHAKYIAPPNW